MAQDFVKAFADGDLNEAATYLAPGTEPYPGWRREVERNVAFNFEFLVEPCEAKTKTTIGTVVECPFDMHVLYSKELGEGPFTGNMFTVFVEDGAVLEADNVMAWQTNGQEEYFDKVWNWIKRHHPDDVALMAMDEQEVQPAAWPRYLRLWEQHTRDYYQTMTSESDG